MSLSALFSSLFGSLRGENCASRTQIAYHKDRKEPAGSNLATGNDHDGLKKDVCDEERHVNQTVMVISVELWCERAFDSLLLVSIARHNVKLHRQTCHSKATHVVAIH